MGNIERKKQADKYLYELGLFNKLEEYGIPHIIGSYRMNMMACNDLDIDVSNDIMSIDKLYELTKYILDNYKPLWYEAKQEINDEGKTVWFQGFETILLGEKWNFDIWFFDTETISGVEKFCDNISTQVMGNPEFKEYIINIKEFLIDKELYSFDKYISIDVYKAVIENGIRTGEEFLEKYKK
jgi:hypothetical protein